MKKQDSGRDRSRKKSNEGRKSKGNTPASKAPKRKLTGNRRPKVKEQVQPSRERTFDQYKNKDINELKLPKLKEERIRLNRYIANAGVCSRREADQLIKLGLVTVNGKMVTELGIKVGAGDVVKYDGATLSRDAHRYVLLNKPKNFVTSLEGDKSKRTVMNLVEKACKEKIYPVGKLDRNTSGLLLFTNDADLAKKLTNPKQKVEQLYFAQLAEKVKPQHMQMLREGVQTEEGFIVADEIDYVKSSDDARLIGIKVHTSKNRVVRNMLEYFGYTITKLDRVMYASLTKKDLGRGYHRHLTEKEVAFLKML